MKNPAHMKLGIIVGTIFLVVALLVWKLESPKNPPMTSDEIGNQTERSDLDQDMAAEGGPIVEERRVVDVDAVIADIEAAASGDESALDDELSDEILSVQEGRGVIEDLGKSYDETGY